MFYAAMQLKGRVPTEEEAVTLWAKASKKDRKKASEDLSKKAAEYTVNFENFLRVSSIVFFV